MDTVDGTLVSTGKKAIIIFLAAIVVLLGLAIWGGTKVGESRAANQFSELQSASDALRVQLESAQGDLSQTTSRVATLQQDNSVLRTQVGSAETELSQVQSRYGSIQEGNAALRAQVASAQSQLSQMQSMYGSLQDANTALRAQVASAQAQLSQVQSSQSALQQENATLRGQLASWYAWLRSAPLASGATGPSITLGTTGGPAGTAITVTGSGFAANTYGSVFLDINRSGTSEPGEPVQYLTTSPTGTFTLTVPAPSVLPGAYPMLADFPVGPPAEASATFTITAG